MELYKKIKSRREELGMSQETLAQKTGYTSRTSIAKIEAGNVDLPQSKIVQFAKALETTPSQLMGWEDNLSIDTAELTVKLLEDAELTNCIKKIMQLDASSKSIIYNLIDTLAQKTDFKC